MNKIVKIDEATKIARMLREQGKTIVLAGGCFDILHKGHLTYLQNAKKQGDVLFVLLESDVNVRKLKGEGRPVNSQGKRAKNLLEISLVDYVVLLLPLYKDEDYFVITKKLEPSIIAITGDDPKQKEKEEQAKVVGGKLVVVTKRLENYSTTKILSQK